MLCRITLLAVSSMLAMPLMATADELADLKEAVRILQQKVEVLEKQAAVLEPFRLAYERREEFLREVEDLGGTPGPIASTGESVAADTRLMVGQMLQVEWNGEWWAAKVVETLEAGTVRIHYVGWNPGYDEVVERGRIQLDPNALAKAREAVQPPIAVIQSQQPVRGEIDGLPANPGPIASTGKAVTPQTALTAGEVLQVEWGGQWWAAEVLETFEGGNVRIHYLGWDASHDEVVERTRLQLDPDARDKSRETNSSD